jgi:hypothetical protein
MRLKRLSPQDVMNSFGVSENFVKEHISILEQSSREKSFSFAQDNSDLNSEDQTIDRNQTKRTYQDYGAEGYSNNIPHQSSFAQKNTYFSRDPTYEFVEPENNFPSGQESQNMGNPAYNQNNFTRTHSTNHNSFGENQFSRGGSRGGLGNVHRAYEEPPYSFDVLSESSSNLHSDLEPHGQNLNSQSAFLTQRGNYGRNVSLQFTPEGQLDSDRRESLLGRKYTQMASEIRRVELGFSSACEGSPNNSCAPISASQVTTTRHRGQILP